MESFPCMNWLYWDIYRKFWGIKDKLIAILEISDFTRQYMILKDINGKKPQERDYNIPPSFHPYSVDSSGENNLKTVGPQWSIVGTT